jgi:hypothetical protein
MAVPLTRGKPYYAKFTASLSPTENAELSFTIPQKYSFATGNSVIVSGQFALGIRFEGIVKSYNEDGLIVLESITNIKGTFQNNMALQITLAGERGSKIMAANGTPVESQGRPGDLYINSATGEVYIKN